jgi:hypothetical protein
VAGTPNSRDDTGASRSSFEPRHGEAPARWHVVNKPSPATGRQAAVESQHAGTSQRYEPGSLPSRPGPQRLLTIGRLRARAVDQSVTQRGSDFEPGVVPAEYGLRLTGSVSSTGSVATVFPASGLANLGGREPVAEGDGEGVEGGLPAHGPSLAEGRHQGCRSRRQRAAARRVRRCRCRHVPSRPWSTLVRRYGQVTLTRAELPGEPVRRGLRCPGSWITTTT